ncbi:ABC1 kinase family protein [Spirosoma utsteinense]|uniref:Unusual protein kinase regulating ubiquinone biosynthesis (AarF/ABC1/UbiB family) n=1 Tax=Spirosoma utsteinense TaxID=2585773 RepID=A0ABR6VZ68_9BACT|nr:AarF/ABC1/UbiB kinase family protein [Spirosoma utsteinense]MBC3784655.1 putative unusual protein kinase regulating ubiquinone biosynthesis (AarF/ABC1/UbiB family) [Spirosoma utsteinense]MBC3789591.1 putative unusual protein kinase regulating ubiquinone biosynthesis (AarF/ABC1/UbiB family) [Spirosoma utsteinense]
MKTQNSVPTTKVARASQFMKAGVKVGGNYIKHYSKKLLDPSRSKDELHKDNAADIYDALSELKGSALKMAQMLSMDRGLLPVAYSDKFTMAQYSAPPLSGPLVVKTFKTYFGKSPSQLFDKFEIEAVNAASIGQVHQAWKDGKKLAVKVQYPGVADAVTSDLRIAKPLAVTLLNLNERDIDRYMGEVEAKLLEETDYDLELKRSIEISEACSHIKDLVFPRYYPELSSKRILTMDWLDGMHLKEFLKTNPSQEVRNQIGQALWDFYDYQIHTLRQVHADPHPGNFLMRADGTMGVIDFGCVKVIPEFYYDNYFRLVNPDTIEDDALTEQIFENLEFLTSADSPKDRAFFSGLFKQMIRMLGEPFAVDEFNFGDDRYFNEVYAFAEGLTKVDELKSSKVARGSQDGLYVNRTYYGLYAMLNELKATVVTTKPEWLRSKKVLA